MGLEKSPRTTFGAWLREKRKAAGLTQKELIEKIGLNPKQNGGFISNWERGYAIPPKVYRAKLAEVLQTTERELYEQIVNNKLIRAPASAQEAHYLPRQTLTLTTFAVLLRKLRFVTNKKQYEVANAVGISQTMFSLWERGRYTPTNDQLEKLALALNTTADELREALEKNEPITASPLPLPAAPNPPAPPTVAPIPSPPPAPKAKPVETRVVEKATDKTEEEITLDTPIFLKDLELACKFYPYLRQPITVRDLLLVLSLRDKPQ